MLRSGRRVSSLALRCAALSCLATIVAQPPGPKASSSPAEPPDRLKASLESAGGAFGRNDLAQAERIYREALQEANRRQAPRQTLLSLNGLGAVRARQYRYKEAFEFWMEARDGALRHGLNKEAAALLVNLGSLHFQLGNIAAAEPLVRQASELAADIPDFQFRPQMTLAMGVIRAKQARYEEAFYFFQQAIEFADLAPDDKTLALARNSYGSALIAAGRWREAEHPILEAFRWRVLNRDVDLPSSLSNLAELELRRGRAQAALAVAEKSLELATKQSIISPQYHHLIARIQAASGRHADAMRHLSDAIDEASRLRLDLLPSDQFRAGVELNLARLYEDAIENAAVLRETGQGAGALDLAWLAAGERRAYLLRTTGLSTEQLRDRLSPHYWEQLAQFRRLETQRIAGALPASAGHELERLAVALAEQESSAGIRVKNVKFREKIGQTKSLTPFRNRLSPESALISFHLGDARSHRWELTRAGLSWKPLPSRTAVVELALKFQRAVQEQSREAGTLGMELHRMLFEGMTASAGRAHHWLLDLDGELFGSPLAASVSTNRAGGHRFLVEDHTLRVFPGVTALLEDAAMPVRGAMLAVADPIYNRADSRRSDPAAQVVLRGSPLVKIDELPRLPASRVEAEQCAAVWSKSTLLTGALARKRNVEEALAAKPQIIHLATHVLASPEAPDRPLLALGLDERNQLEVLGTSDVMLLPAEGALVVLSGCHSAAGKPMPGAGWLGMTRAWLLAGANSVIASQWPTPDDTGLLFRTFYVELRKLDSRAGGSVSESAAVALRESQLQMARSNTWRAHPNYWATYQLTTRTQ